MQRANQFDLDSYDTVRCGDAPRRIIFRSGRLDQGRVDPKKVGIGNRNCAPHCIVNGPRHKPIYRIVTSGRSLLSSRFHDATIDIKNRFVAKARVANRHSRLPDRIKFRLRARD